MAVLRVVSTNFASSGWGPELTHGSGGEARRHFRVPVEHAAF